MTGRTELTHVDGVIAGAVCCSGSLMDVSGDRLPFAGGPIAGVCRRGGLGGGGSFVEGGKICRGGEGRGPADAWIPGW